jgi:antitoxin component YwqK of YwqJK toxin-antitoxin module
MPGKSSGQAHVHYHKDGSIWARGKLDGKVPVGYWEWFRKDGSKMRSGWFEHGEQAGEWTTFDRTGRVVKVTQMQAGKAARTR